MEDIKVQCETLVNHESMDKETALGVLKMHHGMENIVQQIKFQYESEVAKLSNELTMERTKHDLPNLYDEHKKVEHEITIMKEMLETLKAHVENLNEKVVQMSMLQKKR